MRLKAVVILLDLKDTFYICRIFDGLYSIILLRQHSGKNITKYLDQTTPCHPQAHAGRQDVHDSGLHGCLWCDLESFSTWPPWCSHHHWVLTLHTSAGGSWWICAIDQPFQSQYWLLERPVPPPVLTHPDTSWHIQCIMIWVLLRHQLFVKGKII